MLVLAPVMCILSGIGVSQVLSTYMKNLDISRPDKKSKKQQDSTYPIKNEVSECVKVGLIGEYPSELEGDIVGWNGLCRVTCSEQSVEAWVASMSCFLN